MTGRLVHPSDSRVKESIEEVHVRCITFKLQQAPTGSNPFLSQSEIYSAFSVDFLTTFSHLPCPILNLGCFESSTALNKVWLPWLIRRRRLLGLTLQETVTQPHLKQPVFLVIGLSSDFKVISRHFLTFPVTLLWEVCTCAHGACLAAVSQNRVPRASTCGKLDWNSG